MQPVQAPKQKKILLAAVNASYVHSNPAVYALRRNAYACAENLSAGKDNVSLVFPQIDIAEYTINDRYEDILFDLIGKNADVIGLSVYIWNAGICLSLLEDLRRLCPSGSLILFAGGPEAATHPESYLESCDFVLTGEGETSFSRLCVLLSETENAGSFPSGGSDPASLADALPGAVYRKDKKLCFSSAGMPVSEIETTPFLYDGTEDFANRIVYYESSRGCPFHCSYCLSSVSAPVRFRRLETVLEELQFFLDGNVSLVKFVDRTFNTNASRARAIWTYIRDHDNQLTCFHFEIGADLLREEDLSFLRTLRPGLIQLETGIQSANPETLAAIRRTADNDRIFHAVRTLAEAQNIALHTDLIAGLPYEDFSSFADSFNRVYDL
ncbi:MAG: B12-binding domain-containing radical SAM protein, partial [Eubacterium sp.]|nr:B12-binding domain-containing radical SAM protein [Eubacterium sp.]